MRLRRSRALLTHRKQLSKILPLSDLLFGDEAQESEADGVPALPGVDETADAPRPAQKRQREPAAAEEPALQRPRLSGMQLNFISLGLCRQCFQ